MDSVATSHNYHVSLPFYQTISQTYSSGVLYRNGVCVELSRVMVEQDSKKQKLCWYVTNRASLKNCSKLPTLLFMKPYSKRFCRFCQGGYNMRVRRIFLHATPQGGFLVRVFAAKPQKHEPKQVFLGYCVPISLCFASGKRCVCKTFRRTPATLPQARTATPQPTTCTPYAVILCRDLKSLYREEKQLIATHSKERNLHDREQDTTFARRSPVV